MKRYAITYWTSHPTLGVYRIHRDLDDATVDFMSIHRSCIEQGFATVTLSTDQFTMMRGEERMMFKLSEVEA